MRRAVGSSGEPTMKRCTPAPAWNSTDRPSGDHWAPPTGPSGAGRMRGSPPDSGSTKHRGVSSARVDTNSSDAPSGDTRGPASTAEADVSRSGRPPRTGTRHRFET